MKKNSRFSRSKPTVHNQNKPFDRKKYGPTWDHISFELRTGEHQIPEGSNQPIIGTLFLGKCGHIDLTYTECSKIIETLQDCQYTARVAQRLDAVAHNAAGSPTVNDNLSIRRMN